MTDFSKKGPNLVQPSQGWNAGRGKVEPTEAGLHFEAPGLGRFSWKAAVEPKSEYFFSVKVKSPDRAVFAVGRMKLSYHDQGNWGEVCGLVRVDEQKEIEVSLQLQSLEKRGATARLDLKEMTFEKVERPAAVSGRHFEGETFLAENGKAEAAIVYPSTMEAEKRLATSLQAKIEQRAGVRLPVLADTEVTEKDAPVVTGEFQGKNLILIGRLGTNRAMAAAYSRFLGAVDGYYPGGDGYVVRTAANVYGNGKNHLILGGSQAEGVASAVQQFLGLLDKAEVPEKGTLRLPWLLDVRLGGKCLENFRQDDARWKDPANPALPPMTPGYGKVSRWYQNAMGYYWSGWPGYLERSRGYLREILKDKAYTHHYLIEFFVRTYDMFDDSPVLTQADKKAFDALLVENFLDFMTGPDASWMTTFSPPYQGIGLVNRHQVAPWYADLLMAKYAHGNLRLSGALKALVDFRFGEKDKVFGYLVSNRSGPNDFSLGNAAYEEIAATFFRYAMENDLYREFFGSGLAHSALGLERIDPLNGMLTLPLGGRDLPIWLGATAMVQNDGRYRWLAEKIPFPAYEASAFQGRYVAGVHRYAPGEELPAVEPDRSWLGITISPEPTRRDGQLVPPTKAFPLVAMRSGFGPHDDYVAVAGRKNQQPAGTLAALIVRGVRVFMAVAPQSGDAANRTTTNGATAVRLTDYSPGSVEMGDEECSLDWTAETPGCWAFRIGTAIAPEVRWTRETIRLGPGVFVFCDRFTASKAGEYALRVNWQAGHWTQESGGVWQRALSTGTVQMKMLGDGFEPQRREGTLAWASVRPMQPGKPVAVWTVFQAKPRKDSRLEASLQTPGQISVTTPESGPVVLHAGDAGQGSEAQKADLIVMDRAGVSILPGPQAGNKAAVYLPRAEPGRSFKAIETALNAKPEAARGEPAQEPANSLAIRDETGQWKAVWHYDGLQKPVQARPRLLGEEVVDFGSVVSLDEIRSFSRSMRVWEPSSLPKEIRIAPSASDAPPAEADGWTLLTGKRISRPGTRTGNYGESHAMAHADESLFVDGVKTRFLKSEGASTERYFIRDARAARHPVRVEVLRDLPGAGGPVVLACSDLFPAFPRPLRDDDFSLALLKPEGSALAALDVPGPVQGVLVADRQGKGNAEIMVLKADASLELFDLAGHPGQKVDLAAMQEEFNRKHGHENTRHPAGGQFMPFSLGLWRANPAGAKKMIVARYGNLSFLDENLRFEGVLAAGYYACSGMLPHGYDFKGSGKDEMLILERSLLLQVGGDSTARVRYKRPAIFWPEVYDALSEKDAKDAASRLLAGAPILIFDVLNRFGGRPRYAIVARGNYAGLYDAVEMKWVSSWQPPAPISAAAITRESAGEAEIRLSTVDGLWWKVIWKAGKLETPAIEVSSPGFVANGLRGTPSRDGRAVMTTNDGLLLVGSDGGLRRIARGPFQSADFVSDKPGAGTIVASDGEGKVIGFGERP